MIDRIYIPTLGRPNEQVTWDNLPTELKKKVWFVIHEKEKDLYDVEPDIPFLETFLIGKDAGETITTGNNNICLGYNSQPSSATVDNEIILGQGSSQTLRCATQTISSLSDRRDKIDIVGIPIGLDFVNKLRPVKFKWDIRNVEENNPHQGTVRAGFIAQELQEVQEGNEFMDLVYDPNPDRIEARYSNLIPVLTKAIQELSAENTALKARLDAAGI